MEFTAAKSVIAFNCSKRKKRKNENDLRYFKLQNVFQITAFEFEYVIQVITLPQRIDRWTSIYKSHNPTLPAWHWTSPSRSQTIIIKECITFFAWKIINMYEIILNLSTIRYPLWFWPIHSSQWNGYAIAQWTFLVFAQTIESNSVYIE